MSRIGNRLLSIPANTQVSIQANSVSVSSQNKQLVVNYPVDLIAVQQVDNKLKVTRANDENKPKCSTELLMLI